ncbi:MAG: 16S rRNA processing protein RimM [Rickettsiales bacterium]|nr:MAG: 16S rRNA processing protein RimM [Rickettsiales bacterium]
MSQDNNLILVGVISGAHGIKGDVLIRSFTKPFSNIFSLNITDIEGNKLKIKKITEKKQGTIISRIESCINRNQAESLKGTSLYCHKENMPKLDDDEYYYNDLKNIPIFNEEGQKIAIVLGIVNFGAGDIVDIKFDNNKEEMLPFTKQFFPKIEKDYIVLANSYLSMIK